MHEFAKENRKPLYKHTDEPNNIIKHHVICFPVTPSSLKPFKNVGKGSVTQIYQISPSMVWQNEQTFTYTL